METAKAERKGITMLPLVTYETLRRLEEERRERSLARYWWRHSQPEEPRRDWPAADAEVIELVFGPQCEATEPLGA